MSSELELLAVQQQMKFRNADQQYLYETLHSFIDSAKSAELRLGALCLLMAFEGYKVPYLVKRSGIKSGQRSKPQAEKPEDDTAEVIRELEEGA